MPPSKGFKPSVEAKRKPVTETADWQVCLAHQLRNCQYAIEAGDGIFAHRMKRLLLWAIAARRRWDSLAASTQYQYGFRSEWGRDVFADVRSIVNTGKRQGLSAFQSISYALNPLKSLFPLS